MSKDKHKYGGAAIPDVPKKASGTGSSGDSGGRLKEIEDAIDDIKNSMVKSNRDNLDSMYNIGEENLDGAFRRLLKSYSDGIASAQASIKTLADNTGAQISSIAEWQETVENGTISSIAGIKQTANAAKASVDSFAEWKNTTSSTLSTLSSSVATISSTANANGASISQIVSAVGANGQVNAASIVAAVNSADSTVVINAGHVDIDSVVNILKESESLLLEGDSIRFQMDGNNDDGENVFGANSEILFDLYYEGSYEDENGALVVGTEHQTLGTISTEAAGSGESTRDPRYSVEITTNRIYNVRDESHDVALKLDSAASAFLRADDCIFLEAQDSARIRAYMDYRDLNYKQTGNWYVFCTDGIYYDGVKVLSV